MYAFDAFNLLKRQYKKVAFDALKKKAKKSQKCLDLRGLATANKSTQL